MAAMRSLRHHPSFVESRTSDSYSLAHSTRKIVSESETLRPASGAKTSESGKISHEQRTKELCASREPSRAFWPKPSRRQRKVNCKKCVMSHVSPTNGKRRVRVHNGVTTTVWYPMHAQTTTRFDVAIQSQSIADANRELSSLYHSTTPPCIHYTFPGFLQQTRSSNSNQQQHHPPASS